MSKSWMIKELSLLAKVSVATLHHYDEIGLLKPSLRRENGYRVYSEHDLAKLQQIIALKYLGFQLKQIKLLLEKKVDLFEQLDQQRVILKQKEESFYDLRKSLEKILSSSKSKEISLQILIDLIERFNMKQQHENAWMAEVIAKNGYFVSEGEIKALEEISNVEWDKYNKKWHKIVAEISYMVKEKIDPCGCIGQLFVHRFMEHALKYYSKDLWNAIWMAIQSGDITEEYKKMSSWPEFSQDEITWIKKALRHHNNR